MGYRAQTLLYPPLGDVCLAAFEETLRHFVQNVNPDVPIDASTGRGKWLGERMDYSTAIEAVQSREHGCWVNGNMVIAGANP